MENKAELRFEENYSNTKIGEHIVDLFSCHSEEQEISVTS